jgi:hypothetical protein
MENKKQNPTKIINFEAITEKTSKKIRIKCEKKKESDEKDDTILIKRKIYNYVFFYM